MDSNRKSNPSPAGQKPDPEAVPDKVKIQLGDIGPALARAAIANGRTLSEEIRRRLAESLTSTSDKSK